MAQQFQGKVALVTGGASGIGKVTAQIFAREGAKVIVATDSNIKGGEETVSLIKAAGGQATFVKCDVSKAADVEAMMAECVHTYGRLDFAFNNAGIGPDGKRVPFLSIVDTTEEVWDRTVNINLKGVFLCMKYEIKQMLKQQYGVIINTSSVGALKPSPNFCAYSATKSGVISLTRTAAQECGHSGIRVNSILPGPTDNTLLWQNLTSTMPDDKNRIGHMIPVGRVGQPEDMAEAVIWLCSDAASFINGQALPVDGGMTAG